MTLVEGAPARIVVSVLRTKRARKGDQGMAKEVKIELTEAQKAKIKAATGKTMSELKVTSVGTNVAVSTSETSARISEQGLRQDGMRAIGEQATRAIGEQATRAIGE